MQTQNSSNKLITVYHGTIEDFAIPDISKGKSRKDFGPGFYLTKSRTHAVNLAKRNLNEMIKQKRRSPMDKIFLYEYQINENDFKNFNTLFFTEADMEWIQFILKNRSANKLIHPYQIVCGPTANDDTNTVLKAYYAGLYGNDLGCEKVLNRVVEMLEPENLPYQICFCDQNCVELLQNKAVERI